MELSNPREFAYYSCTRMKNLDKHLIYIENQSKDWVDTSDGIVNDVKVW
jgi:hypothetical protein